MLNKKIKISVIVATYNSGKTLARCLDSIVSQLGDIGELLVIDGGSTDNTMDIVRSYGCDVSFSISEKDRGVYDAWNKGVKKARGQWITFIGSDDMMLPNAFNLYESFFDKNGEDFDLVCGKLFFVDEKGTVLREVGEPWNWQKHVYRKLKFAHPGMLHNKRCFDKIGYFDLKYKICADSDFLQRIGPDAKGGFIDDFIVRMSQGGMSDGIAAMREGFLSRKNNKCLPLHLNYIAHYKMMIRYYGGKLLRFLKLK